jgi:hypothetical protein
MSPKETAQTHLLSCSIRPAPHRASTAASPPTPSRSLLCYLLCSSATTTLPLLLCSTRIHAAFSRWPEAEATRGSLLDSGDRRGRHWRGRSLPARGGKRQPWIWRWGRSSGGVRVPSSLRRSSLLSAALESRMVSLTPNRRHCCSSPAPPTRLLHPTSPTPGRRQALLAQRSCLLTRRRAGVHLCIFSLIGRRFASPFVSVVEKCGRHNCERQNIALGLNVKVAQATYTQRQQ